MNKEDEQNERRPRCTKDSREDITIFFPLLLLLQLFRSQVLYFFLTENTALICMPIDLTFPLRKSELLKGTEN